MTNDSRRDFLRKSFIGISGAALVPGMLNKADAASGTINSQGIINTQGLGYTGEDDLPVRTLGRTGLNVPLISMGVEGANSAGIIKAAYENGIRMFFSATYYGEGNNEKLLGDAIKGLARDTLILGSAVIPKGVDHRGGTYTGESTYEQQIKTAEECLKRFGLEYLDFMLLPYAGKRESVFFEPLLRAMEDLKKQGKTRFVGLATHSFQDEAIIAAADTKVYDMVMPQYNFRVGNAAEINKAIEYAIKAGVGIVAMKSQAGGYWDRDRKEPINSDAALKWVLRNENITSVVSGMTNFNELTKNLALIKGDLKPNEQDMKDLKLASFEYPSELWCKQCRQCSVQCKQNLDIPTIMRSYMYAYGYRNLEKARYTLVEAGLAEFPCSDCSACNIECKAGFDIRRKVSDVSRLLDVPMDFLKA
jgi:predicted aldo/keto reductase-like oxidoreductase